MATGNGDLETVSHCEKVAIYVWHSSCTPLFGISLAPLRLPRVRRRHRERGRGRGRRPPALDARSEVVPVAPSRL